MRLMHLSFVVLIACGGGQAAQPQPPMTNTVPPTQPTTPPQPAELDKSVCSQKSDDFGPITLTAAQVGARTGTGATKFADSPTTKERPIEVCSPRGQHAWLQSVTCNDGSKPSSADRSGNVGPGGRCGTIIDLYVAVCPEKQYDVFMDMYMCGPGESL